MRQINFRLVYANCQPLFSCFSVFVSQLMIRVDIWQEILDFDFYLVRGGKIERIILHLLSIQCMGRQE